MAESVVLNAEASVFSDGYMDPPAPSANGSSSSSSIVQRRIDFHPARKPFNGFSNGGGDFRQETVNPSSDSKRPPPNQGQSAKGGRRIDGSEFLENGSDPELSLGITVRKIGAGLENLGNTCFLNSVLQCLTHTQPLAAYLQSGKHQISCKVAGFCALCAIQKHVSRALQSTGRILAPKDLVSNLRCISRNFRNARQEDAHEYMVNLLESMHKCCLPSGIPSESPSAYDKSLVHKIFGGRLRSQVKCTQCNYCSNTFDPFIDLSLEIVKADSLQKALMNFTAPEHLDGGEKQYQCQKCRQKVRALKQLTVHKAPYVLTIHLKRFRAYNPGQKIDKKVQFGSTLDLKPFVSGSYEGDLKYTLYGVLVHCGFSTHSGHYYSFVRTSGGTWYNLDDNQVASVGERTVLGQEAYMLFYVRDRRNSAPRKSIDVVQKGNMKASNGGNTTLFNSKQGFGVSAQNVVVENRSNGLANSTALALNIGSTKLGYSGSVQDGIVGNKSNSADCSADITLQDKKHALNVGSTKQGYSESVMNASVEDRPNGPACPAPPTKEDALIVGSTGELHLRSNVSEKDEAAVPELTLEAASSEDQLKGLSLSNSDLGKQLQESERVRALSSGDTMETTDETSRKDLIASVDVVPSSNALRDSAIDKLPSEETSQKINPASKVTVSSLASSFTIPADKTLEKIELVKSPDQLSNDGGQIEHLNGSAANDSLFGKAGDRGQRFAPDARVERLVSSITTNGSPNKDSQRKIRKKLLRYQVASMRLGAKILFTLGKKFKKRKHRGLDSKNLSKELLLSSPCISSDLGPSTSTETRRISLRTTHVKKRAGKSASKRTHITSSASTMDTMNSNSDSMISNEKFSGSIRQNNDALAAKKHSEKASSSCAAGKPSDCKESDGLKGSERELMQNGFMSMLTRGLEETHVPRWDGVDLPSSQSFAQSKSPESVSIGFVGDEWDEEYDRGKRKKVRTFKHEFGGPNLFQEIASEKMQSKKPRMEQSSSGNRPFRIQS